MKNLKISLTAIVAAIILAISTGVYAHGSQVDTLNQITMPGSLNNGKGTVTSSISGEMSYQFVETTSEKYALIKKYEAQINLISAYINSDNNYDKIAENYESTYNQTANGIMTEYGIQFNEEGLAAVKGLWITELDTYSESNWTKAEGTTISLDLTTFNGTKYFVGWVKIGDTYDAEVYKVTGTKKDDQNNNNTTNNTVKNDTKNTTPTKNETKTNGTTNTPTTITTSKSTASKLPHTGVNDVIVGLIATASTASGIAYLRYRKIK